jgi:hypothetical protein
MPVHDYRGPGVRQREERGSWWDGPAPVIALLIVLAAVAASLSEYRIH